jgi:hypothetical protein
MRDNIRVESGEGGDCCICDVKLPTGAPVIAVTFDVPVLVTFLKVSRRMHVECAEELSGILRLAVKQARQA